MAAVVQNTICVRPSCFVLFLFLVSLAPHNDVGSSVPVRLSNRISICTYCFTGVLVGKDVSKVNDDEVPARRKTAYHSGFQRGQ